jgi:hypothetical protein
MAFGLPPEGAALEASRMPACKLMAISGALVFTSRGDMTHEYAMRQSEGI